MIAYLKKSKTKKNIPAVFLDRDGTIIRDRAGHYLTDTEKLQIYKYSAKALKILRDAGFRLILITNQSAVGRKYMSRKKSIAINRFLAKKLKKDGALLDAIYFCPHAPEDECSCRKPAPGLIKEAIRYHRIDLKNSFVIGDKKSDMDMALKLKLKSFMVLSGQGKKQIGKYKRIKADYTVKNILSAARIIAHKIERN